MDVSQPKPDLLSATALDEALAAVAQAVPQQVAGRVTELTGLVLRATAPGARAGDLVEITRPSDRSRGDAPETEPLVAEVVGFAGQEVVLLPLGSTQGVGPSSVVRPLGKPFTVQVGVRLLGRVLNAYGRPIDAGADRFTEMLAWPVERDAPAPLHRRRLSEALPMGIRAIDGLLTVGQGQRLGLFAGPGHGKTTLRGGAMTKTGARIS